MTARSSADLYILMADNDEGQYTPVVDRDAVESRILVYGTFDIDAPAETTIAAVDTPVKSAGTTTAGVLRGFTHTDNRLTYTSIPDCVVMVSVNAEIIAAGNGKIIGVTIAKNGTPTGSIKRYVATGTDVGAAGTNWTFELSTGDYLELWLENATDATNITAQDIHFSAIGGLL